MRVRIVESGDHPAAVEINQLRIGVSRGAVPAIDGRDNAVGHGDVLGLRPIGPHRGELAVVQDQLVAAGGAHVCAAM